MPCTCRKLSFSRPPRANDESPPLPDVAQGCVLIELFAHELEAVVTEEHRSIDEHGWSAEDTALAGLVRVGVELSDDFGRVETGRDGSRKILENSS